MDWLSQTARRCRELIARAQNASIAEQLQIWAEELELEGAARRSKVTGASKVTPAVGSAPALSR